MVYYHQRIFLPKVFSVSQARNLAGGYSYGNDFYPIWLTTRERLHDHRDLYSPEMTREIQKGLFGRPLDSQISSDPLTDYRTFAYPAFTDLLFWPAAEFSFPTVRVLVILLLAALTALSVPFWICALSWRVDWLWLVVILLLVLFSYPVLEGLCAAQLGLFVGFLLSASMVALISRRSFLAGVLLALTTIKPQMTGLAILFLMLWAVSDWQGRRRFCFGFISALAALVIASLVVWPHWIESWIAVVLGYHRYAKPPLVSEVLFAPLGAGLERPFSVTLTAILWLAAAVMGWRNRVFEAGSVPFWLVLSFLLAVTSVTLLPGQALHDHVILLPGIFFLAARKGELASSRIAKILLELGAGVVLWPWISAIALIALRPVLTNQAFNSKAVFVLPLRTAGIFPFLVVGLLVLALRRFGRHPDSPIKSSPAYLG